MVSQNLLSVLAALLIFTSVLTGSVGAVAADQPTPDTPTVVPQQEALENTTTTQANNSTNNTTTTEDDSQVSVDVQVGPPGDSNSDSSGEESSNSANATPDEPIITASDADHIYGNGLRIKEEKVNRTHAVFSVYNPTNESLVIATQNGERPVPDQDQHSIPPKSTRTITDETTGSWLFWEVSVTVPQDIVVDAGGSADTTGSTYYITHYPIPLNWNPVDYGILIAIIGALVILTEMEAIRRFDSRITSLAIPKDGQPVRGDYDLPDGVENPTERQEIARDLVFGASLVVIHLALTVLGFFAFFELYPLVWVADLFSIIGVGSQLSNIALVFSNLMVYWMYITVIFGLAAYILAKKYLKKNGYHLHDVAPWMGEYDYVSWTLTQAKWRDFQPYKKLKDDEDNIIGYVPIKKKRLKEVNHGANGKHFAIESYYPGENIGILTLEGVDPSKLSQGSLDVGEAFEIVEFYRAKFKRLKSNTKYYAKKWGRQMIAINTGRVEGELQEGAEQMDGWIDDDLEDSEFSEVTAGEKTIEDELREDHGEVSGLTDQNADEEVSGDSR